MKCRSCGADIKWITTLSGKKMPVNNVIINIVPDKDGNVIAVTTDGRVIRGRQTGDANEQGYYIAYISHFATCPEASKYRKSEK